MWLISRLLNRIAHKFGIPDSALAYLRPISVTGRRLKFGIPKDLISINALMTLRGILNRIVISTNANWIWPYWAVKQYDPNSFGFVPRGFQIPSLNMAYRNWTSIGTLDSIYEAIVDERGLVTPYNNSWSLDCWVIYKNKLYAPSQINDVHQYNESSLPIIVTEFSIEALKIKMTVFAERIQDQTVILHRFEAENWSKEEANISLVYSIRPYNPEGVSIIHNIEYKPDGGFYVNGRLGVSLMPEPKSVICCQYKEGDASKFLLKNYKVSFSAKCPAGLATAAAEYPFLLKPGETRYSEARIPMDIFSLIKPHHLSHLDFNYKKQCLLDHWANALEKTMTITIPDKTLEKAFNINKAYMLLFLDRDSITPGPFTYHHFWFRDAAYLLQALSSIGCLAESKRVLMTYPKKQHLTGFFYSQMGEWDSNGQAIWSLVHYYRMTRDIDFLQRIYPNIISGIKWIIKKLKETRNEEIPFKGLMPPGLSAEHFGMNDVYYWDNFWSLAGFKDAIYAAEQLKKNSRHILWLKTHYHTLQEHIENSLFHVAARFTPPMLPISPNREMDSAVIGNLSAIYPLHVYPVTDQRFVNSLHYLEEKCFSKGGFFHDVNHSGFGTYLTTHIIQMEIFRKNKKALDVLNWLMKVATPTFTWPESIHPHTLGGLIGDGHHGWAAADFLMVIRHLLFFEDKDRLILTPILPQSWINPGEVIHIDRAPSFFGLLSFLYKFETHEVHITFKHQFHEIPREIEINLPVKITSYDADGTKYSVTKKSSITVKPTTKNITIYFHEYNE